jgi:hypothetical protein
LTESRSHIEDFYNRSACGLPGLRMFVLHFVKKAKRLKPIYLYAMKGFLGLSNIKSSQVRSIKKNKKSDREKHRKFQRLITFVSQSLAFVALVVKLTIYPLLVTLAKRRCWLLYPVHVYSILCLKLSVSQSLAYVFICYCKGS